MLVDPLAPGQDVQVRFAFLSGFEDAQIGDYLVAVFLLGELDDLGPGPREGSRSACRALAECWVDCQRYEAVRLAALGKSDQLLLTLRLAEVAAPGPALEGYDPDTPDAAVDR